MRRLFALLKHYQAEARFAFRVTVAAVMAYWLAEELHFAQSYWALLSVIIVMQANLGGSLKATIERLVGTLGGTVWGVAVCLLLPPRGAHEIVPALALAVAPLALASALRPTLRVAPVSAVIVLVGATQGHASVFVTAVDRTMEIALGCFIALLAAVVIFPARAHRDLMETAADALGVMREEILYLTDMLAGTASGVGLHALQARLRAAVVKADTVTAEAERERKSHLWEGPDLRPLTRTLWRLRGDLAVMARAATVPLPTPLRDELLGPLRAAAGAVAQCLRGTGKALVSVGPPPEDLAAPALERLIAALAVIREDEVFKAIPSDTVLRLSGLAFALEQMRGNLADLAARTDELHRWRAPLPANPSPAADA